MTDHVTSVRAFTASGLLSQLPSFFAQGYVVINVEMGWKWIIVPVYVAHLLKPLPRISFWIGPITQREMLYVNHSN